LKRINEVIKLFPKSFWSAIIIELLHCLASYSMMAYLVIYLAKDLHLGEGKANFLIGLMFFMGYCLPIFIGAVADRKGFKETMTVSLLFMSMGYFYASKADSFVTILIALLSLSLGGAVMKPVIAGTVKMTSTDETRTVGFSIYYMVINVGSFAAPFLANLIRTKSGHPEYIFIGCAVIEAAAFLLSLLLYTNPEKTAQTGFSFLKTFRDIFSVLKDYRLMLFIFIFSGVWALYSQIWSNIPLFITWLDPKMSERIEWFQAVDPILIILLQIPIGKLMSRFRPIPSMITGILISMAAVSSVGFMGNSFGAPAIAFSLALWAIGEMMFSPRSIEYVSVIAPKDKLALYIGYGFLPLAIGLGVGPTLGSLLKTFLEKKGASILLWPAFGLFAAFIALLLYIYDRFVVKKREN
jgi:proton-dependent oligopeptide transporter, POT family